MSYKSYKKIVLCLIVVMLLLSLPFLAFVSTAEKEEIRLVVGAGHPKAGMSYVFAMDEFFLPEVSKRVEEQTKYKINWVTAYAGSIAQLAEVLEATETGLLDIGLVSFPFEPTKLFLHNLNYYVPFNSPDPVQATRVTRKLFDEMPFFTEAFYNYNQKMIALAPTGNYQLNTTSPVTILEDLRGKKIAAAGPNLNLLKNIGAVPVQSNLNEAYQAYETGMYDGWIMYPGATNSFKLYEVAPYQTNVNYGSMCVNAVTINLDTWDRLSKEVQEIILEVGKEYDSYAAEVSKRWDKEAEEKMVAEGFTIIDFPEEEREKYADLLPNIPNEMAKDADSRGLPGTEAFTRYLELLEEDGFKLPRKWAIK